LSKCCSSYSHGGKERIGLRQAQPERINVA
jgi:hypothetical protein